MCYTNIEKAWNHASNKNTSLNFGSTLKVQLTKVLEKICEAAVPKLTRLAVLYMGNLWASFVLTEQWLNTNTTTSFPNISDANQTVQSQNWMVQYHRCQCPLLDTVISQSYPQSPLITYIPTISLLPLIPFLVYQVDVFQEVSQQNFWTHSSCHPNHTQSPS
jgi:hypothetical protein